MKEPLASSRTDTDKYAAPELQTIHVRIENVVCQSQASSTNEEIGYEDWD